MSGTILFQGDSITDGNRGRDDDPNHLWGHGYVFLIAAELGLKGPDASPRIINRGISGHRVSDLYGRWEEDALALKPDLLSLLVGVNDVHAIVEGRQDPLRDRFDRTYRRMLEDTMEFLPACGIVLLEPFVLPAGWVADNWQEWHKVMSVKQEQVARIAEDYKLPLIPLQASFNEAAARTAPDYWLWDGIHPTPAGHALLRDRWMQFYEGWEKVT